MFVMARLVSCISLGEMYQLFTSLCILCLSRVRYFEIEEYVDKFDECNMSKL